MRCGNCTKEAHYCLDCYNTAVFKWMTIETDKDVLNKINDKIEYLLTEMQNLKISFNKIEGVKKLKNVPFPTP